MAVATWVQPLARGRAHPRAETTPRGTAGATITRDGVRRTRPPGCDDADMHAMTVVPGQKGTAGVEEVPDPDAHDAALLVRGMALGAAPPPADWPAAESCA